MKPEQSSVAPTWQRSIAVFVGSLAMILAAVPGLAQTGPGVPTASLGPPLDPRTLSCDTLKDRLQRAGTLNVIGREGWSETFQPGSQCEFWLKPVYQYVTASDGPCGLGFVCTWKPGAR